MRAKIVLGRSCNYRAREARDGVVIFGAGRVLLGIGAGSQATRKGQHDDRKRGTYRQFIQGNSITADAAAPVQPACFHASAA